MSRHAVLGAGATFLLVFGVASAAPAGDHRPEHFVPPITASTVEGEITLTDSPFCEFFVVGTMRGFSLLNWMGGLYVIAEGDLVRGPLRIKGVHTFTFAGSGEMRAQVDEVDADLTRAQQAYYSRCHPLPVEEVASR